jgi:hypothetical protein
MTAKIEEFSFLGAHRGGWGVTKSYINRYPVPSRVRVADPKGKRATALAEVWSKKGANAVSYAETGEDIVKNIPDNSIVMISVDSLQAMARVIQESFQPVQWQIMGRSVRDVILGFSGTLTKGDQELRASSVLLLQDLSPYSLSTSSQHIRTSVLHNRVLVDTRQRVSQHSAESLVRLAENSKAGELRLFLGTESFPLAVIKGKIEPFKQVEKRALEVEHPQFANAKDFAVAVVLTNQVEVFVIEKYREKRGIKFYTTFGVPISSPQSDSSNTGTGQVTSVATD